MPPKTSRKESATCPYVEPLIRVQEDGRLMANFSGEGGNGGERFGEHIHRDETRGDVLASRPHTSAALSPSTSGTAAAMISCSVSHTDVVSAYFFQHLHKRWAINISFDPSTTADKRARNPSEAEGFLKTVTYPTTGLTHFCSHTMHASSSSSGTHLTAPPPPIASPDPVSTLPLPFASDGVGTPGQDHSWRAWRIPPQPLPKLLMKVLSETSAVLLALALAVLFLPPPRLSLRLVPSSPSSRFSSCGVSSPLAVSTACFVFLENFCPMERINVHVAGTLVTVRGTC